MGIVFAVLVFWSLAMLYVLRNAGLADNGDFTRSMTVVASEPLDISPNWPTGNAALSQRRFDNYWIQFWRMGSTPPTDPSSSGFMFILGGFVNRLFGSPKVIDMNYMALAYWGVVPMTLGLLWLWTSRGGYSAGVYAAIAIPVALILSAGDYIVYWKSFYQEGGVLVYTVLCLIAFTWFVQGKSIYALALCVAFGFLVATSKPSVFWFPVVLAGVLALVIDGRAWKIVLVGTGIILTCASLAILPDKSSAERFNQFNALFDGALLFSECPSCRLAEIGLPECDYLIGKTAFSSDGREFLDKHGAEISFASSARVIIAEPAIAIRELAFAASMMQDTSLDNLGHFPEGRDETIIGSDRERLFRWDNFPWATLFWPALKYYLFPRGWFLIVGLLVASVASAIGLRSGSPFSAMCLLCSVACLASIVVAIFGDGRNDIIKHLFFSNLIFDCVLVSLVSWIATRN